jgi:hypothetical protein
MTFSAKTVAGRWLIRGAVCVLFVSVALYIFNRFSANRRQPSQRNTSKAQTQLGSVQVPSPRTPTLQINSVIQHGHIIEIQGSTDPGAVVMINGQTASTIEGNSFRHFLGPLPSGTSIITVTSQDEHGGVNTQQIAATIEQ